LAEFGALADGLANRREPSFEMSGKDFYFRSSVALGAALPAGVAVVAAAAPELLAEDACVDGMADDGDDARIAVARGALAPVDAGATGALMAGAATCREDVRSAGGASGPRVLGSGARMLGRSLVIVVRADTGMAAALRGPDRRAVTTSHARTGAVARPSRTAPARATRRPLGVSPFRSAPRLSNVTLSTAPDPLAVDGTENQTGAQLVSDVGGVLDGALGGIDSGASS
jgi:hypothetical protein